MDGYLAVISRREVREYTDAPVPPEQLERILQAGRASGSSRNRQPWRFVVVTDRRRLGALAEAVYAPENIRGCQVAVAIVLDSPQRLFDGGRVAQNMMIAAWNDGVGSCPNSVRDAERARQVLQLGDDDTIATILSLGYPRRPWSPEARPVDEILRRIDRKPLSDLVRWL